MGTILGRCVSVAICATLLGWNAGAAAHTIDLHHSSPGGVSFSEGAGPVQFYTMTSSLNGMRNRRPLMFATAMELRSAPPDIAGFARLSIHAGTPASFDDLRRRIKLKVERVTAFTHTQQSGYSSGMTAGTAEGDTWLMLGVGLGLIGYQLRRKQRSLQPHPFIA